MKRFDYFLDDADEDYYRYDVDNDRICDAIVDIMSEMYNIEKEKMRLMLDTEDLYDILEKNLESELEDYFYPEALAKWTEEYEETHSKYCD